MSISIKKLKALAKESQRPLAEVFADIPGSFSDYRKQVKNALKTQRPGPLSSGGNFYIDALICDEPLQVLIEVPKYGPDGYTQECWQFDLEFSDTDGITFQNATQVVYDVQVKAKNEFQALQETLSQASGGKKPFTEVLDSTVKLEPLSEEAKRSGKKQSLQATVEIAQRADTVNKNNRYYAGTVLSEAVAAAQTRIATYGPLLMDSQHRQTTPGNSTPLREQVALIHEVEYDAAAGVVKLPKIQFVETQAGKDILALLEAGATLQVSQNGYGASHNVFNSDLGVNVEHVDYLRIDGWDLVPSGKAGVADATLTTEGSANASASATVPPATSPGSANVNGNKPMQEGSPSGAETPSASTPATSGTPSVTGASTAAASTAAASTATEPTSSTGEGHEPDAAAIQEAVQSAVATALDTQARSMREEFNRVLGDANAAQSDYERQQAALAQEQATLSEEARKQRLAHLNHVGGEIVESVLAGFKRFNPSQLALIRNKIHIGTYLEKISDVYNTPLLTEAITDDVKAAVREIDEVLATESLLRSGYPVNSQERIVNPSLGDVSVERVFAEAYPNAEMGMRDYNFVNDVLAEVKRARPDEAWIMPEDHASMKVLGNLLADYAQRHSDVLKEQTQQSSVATRIARIAMATIPVIWRSTEAFQIASLGMQERFIDDIPIEQWSPSPTGEPLSQYEQLTPGETAAPTESTLSYTNFRMITTEQKVRVQFTQGVQAMTKNTPLTPVRSSIIYMANQISNAIDSVLWGLLLYHALNYSKTQITAFEVLTQSGSTQTWDAANRAWLPISWLKEFDTNDNPGRAYFKNSTPTSGTSAPPTDLGFQGVEVQVGATTPVPLLFGTDYTVDFQRGAITLTSAGETKRAGASGGANAGKVMAKYTYSTNATPWSLTPASGTQFMQHLVNLRNSVGQAKSRAALRNYTPNRVAFDYELAERVTNSLQFTPVSGTPADTLNMQNEIERFSGMASVRTTSSVLKNWIVLCQDGTVHHNTHTPFSVRGPNFDKNNQDYYIGNQFSASDVPKPDSLSVVAVRA